MAESLAADSRSLLAAAQSVLAAAGVPNPLADALLLLEHATGQPRWRLRLGCPVPADAIEQLNGLVAARATRIPTQHLTGVAHFRRLELAVGPGVFIPRPETELIVDAVMEYLAEAGRQPTLVDLCTGSAAVAIAVATECPGVRVIAVEYAPLALAWAQRNALAHREQVRDVGSQLAVVGGDATNVALPGGGLHHLRGQVAVVVANPPYIPDAAVPRDPEVRDHDPDTALYGGPDGLDIIRPLVAQAAALLRPAGMLLVEHADSQGEDAGLLGVPGVLRADPAAWAEVRDLPDLAGRPRHTRALRRPISQ